MINAHFTVVHVHVAIPMYVCSIAISVYNMYVSLVIELYVVVRLLL